MSYGREVEFHEGGFTFRWYPASREVLRPDGSIISRRSYNLEQARYAARAWIARRV